MKKILLFSMISFAISSCNKKLCEYDEKCSRIFISFDNEKVTIWHNEKVDLEIYRASLNLSVTGISTGGTYSNRKRIDLGPPFLIQSNKPFEVGYEAFSQDTNFLEYTFEVMFEASANFQNCNFDFGDPCVIRVRRN